MHLQRPRPRSGGGYFNRRQIKNMLDIIPANVTKWVWAWDLTATTEDENGQASYIASVLMGKTSEERYVVADVQRFYFLIML